MQKTEIFFTWDIQYECNYNCTYCFLKFEPETTSIVTNRKPAEFWINKWIEIFNKHGRAGISITGGEPFVYPGFMDMIASLTKYHSFEFSTNMSWDEKEFAQKIDKDAVRINPSFHPDFITLEAFLEKYLYLKNKGYALGAVTIVGYPPMLDQLDRCKLEFEKHDIGTVIFPYRGPYLGKKYPESYSEEEKETLRKLGLRLAAAVNKDLSERYNLTEKKENRQEKLCSMGAKYGKIVPNGDVFRCCAAVWTPQKTWTNWGYIGNIIDGSFSFYNTPMPCKTPLAGDCVCYKAMIVGEEDNWHKHWYGIKTEDKK
jgi:MoaA/NifB/PqqE/SkfB family radical SAM enzyme